MKALVRSVVISVISILLLTWLLPSVSVANTVTLIIAGVVLSLLNAILRPILKVLLLPINLITLGLFGWVINLIILWLTMYFVPGFNYSTVNFFGIELNHFWSLVVISFGLSLLQTIIGGVL